MTIEVVDPDEDRVHVIPVFDGERAHDESLKCWCQPRRDDEVPSLIVHNRKAEA